MVIGEWWSVKFSEGFVLLWVFLLKMCIFNILFIDYFSMLFVLFVGKEKIVLDFVCCDYFLYVWFWELMMIVVFNSKLEFGVVCLLGWVFWEMFVKGGVVCCFMLVKKGFGLSLVEFVL